MMIPRRRTICGLLFVALTTCSVVWSATNGPLKRYSKNPIYFADKDDNPVWLTGMSVCCTDGISNGWPWISNSAIDKLAAHGGNWAHVRLGPFTNTEPNPVQVYQKAGDKWELSKWNEDTWSRFRSMLSHARSKGVYIEVDLVDAWILERPDYSPWNGGNNVNGVDAGNCGVTGSAPQEIHKQFLRKVARETADFDNVIFQVGNETFDCGGSSVAWEEGVIKTVEDELQSLGKGTRLFSTNSHNGGVEQSGYVDYVNVHGGGPDGIHHGKPTGNNEYADLSPDGFTGNLWNKFVDGCFFHYWVGSNGSSDRETTYDRIKHFMDFVHSTDFGSFETISDRVTGDEGREYVGYGSSISIDLPEGSYDVSWLNPKSGEKKQEGTVSGGGNKSFNSPGGDQVLHVRKSGDQPPLSPDDDTPPSAPANLSATADGKTRIDLSWDAASDDESGISGYNIYRDGGKVGTSDNTGYSDDGLSEGTTYKYRVSAVNGEGLEGEKSGEATATTEEENDTSPPELASVVAQSATSVKVSFNEPVTGESAGNTDNYEINGGITVGAAELQGDSRSVVLTTSTLAEKTSYTLTVSDITDQSPNANVGGGQMEFMLSGEIQISNLTAASGTSYEIVEAIAEGDRQFVDRSFTWESLDDYAGMAYIRTANDDKAETGESFLIFDINTGATIYVAYRHGTDLPPWLSSWSKTGDQVCGDGCSDVYEKDFNAGTVTLGGNMPGGAGNMYTVFVDAGGSPTDVVSGGSGHGRQADCVGAAFSGAVLRVTGLRPDHPYTVTVTDPSGRIVCRYRGSEVNGGVSLSTAGRTPGVYVVDVRSSNHQAALRTVRP